MENLQLPSYQAINRDVPMEWWYTAAHLVSQDDVRDKFAFVCTFFSYAEQRKRKPGHMLIFSLTRLPNERLVTCSLVDRELRDTAFANLHRAVQSGDAHEYAKAYYESLSRSEIPKPHRLVENSKFDGSNLLAHLGPNRMESTGNAQYSLHLEDHDVVLELKALPSKPSMAGHVDSGLLDMTYYSYARVMLKGALTIGGIRHHVGGSGWIDHQWGSWFKLGETFFSSVKRSLGAKNSGRISWQWFGLQLENDMELAALVPEQTRTKFKPLVTASLPDGKTATLDGLGIQSHSVWQSLRTLKVYPLGWSLQIPELDLMLEMEPIALMELPVFGPIAGVMEVFHEVKGKVRGRDVAGIGWAETVGALFDQRDFWKSQKTSVSSELERIVPKKASAEWLARIASQPFWERDLDLVHATLNKPLWDLLSSGGKRWRPLWMSLCCDAVGGDSEKFRDLLPLPELFHTGSLIVDDIEDHSQYRRGEVSLHVKYGTPIALNLGNTLYYLPLVLIEENEILSQDQKYRLYKVVAESGRRAHLGQAADIFLQSDRIILEDFLSGHKRAKRVLLQAYADKTGTQARALAEMGGIIGKASREQLEGLAEYAEIVGMTFQMINDISNLEQHQKGKYGEDISEGKIRLITLEAISRAGPEGRRRLLEILNKRTRDAELIDEATRVIRESGAIEAIKAEFESYLDHRWDKLSPMLEESESKIMLRSGPKWLLAQDNFEAQL